MFYNYFLIAIRGLVRDKLYSTINIIGLAIGLAACILVVIYSKSEIGYDDFYKNSKNIARVTVKFQQPGAPSQHYATSQVKNGNQLSNYFSEIESFTRMRQVIISVGDSGQILNNEEVFLADDNVFEFFDFKFIHGNKNTALAEPFSIVLTKSLAKKYFPSGEVIGKTLTVNNNIRLKVTGIIDDLPYNTHLDISALVSMASIVKLMNLPHWEEEYSFNYYTYVQLALGTDINKLQLKITDYILNEWESKEGGRISLILQELTSIYLHSHLNSEIKINGDRNVVVMFLSVALIVLLIASINFMNLSTARAAKRAKEVGVRKSMGAHRTHLIVQFLTEALVITGLSLFIACMLVEAILPYLSLFLEKYLTFNYLNDTETFITLLSVWIVVGCLSGSYPAFYLSAFKPTKVLKGELTRGKSGVTFRKLLVVFQFSMAVILMISTASIFLQLKFVRGMDLGYKKDNIIILKGGGNDSVENSKKLLYNRLILHPQIISISSSSRYPTQRMLDSFLFTHPDTNDELQMPVLAVNYNFIDTYRLTLLQGRRFSKDVATDVFIWPTKENPQTQGSIVINEAAMKNLGWNKNNVIGKTITVHFDIDKKLNTYMEIIGVVKDYNFSSARRVIVPTYHVLSPGLSDNFAVHYRGDEQKVSEYINEIWTGIFPFRRIDMSYLDQHFDALYHNEDRQMIIFNVTAALAIMIATLGLFGLASFNNERRIKEIGIRKVHGASVSHLVFMLSTEFSKLVLVANIVAWPIAYFLVREWLNNFIYRMDISIMVFIMSALVAFIIAWFTTGSLAYIAAQNRPIKSLRYE